MKLLKKICRGMCIVTGLLLPVACNTIDEDLSDCGKDYRLDYSLRLITNMTTELETVLNAEADKPMATALHAKLKGIFSDYAYDVDLSFYGIMADSALLHHENEAMNATQSTYTIYLPVKEYMHLALANMSKETVVTHRNAAHCAQSYIGQTRRDTVENHHTGLFTARLPMAVSDTQDQSFYVPLYMANSAVALVVDTTNCHVKGMKAYITDMADGFLLRDSIYTFNDNPIIKTDEIHAISGKQTCFAGVCFPSRNANSHTVRATRGEGGLWHMKLYVALPDGTVTENLLKVHEPLLAGNLKIIKLRLKDKGEAEMITADVGISVTLDWKQGGEYHPSI